MGSLLDLTGSIKLSEAYASLLAKRNPLAEISPETTITAHAIRVAT